LTGVRITSALDEVASKTLDLVSGHAAEVVAEHIEGEWAGRLVDAFLPFRLRHDPSTHAAARRAVSGVNRYLALPKDFTCGRASVR
jgi:hypothetical protein